MTTTSRRPPGHAPCHTEESLGDLLEASHCAAPAAVPGLVARHAHGIGARETVIYLASYEQRFLQPLGGEGVPTRQPLDIDVTLAGRAFRTGTVLDSEDTGQEQNRLWVPLVDGTDRLGVLELVLDVTDADARRAARRFASLVAELVVTRNLYSDVFAQARRRRRMSLAAEMQWNILPPQTFSDGRVTIAGILEPAYEVAGDSFDYAHNGDMLTFAIIDAMGHGFEATLLASVAVGAFRHSRREGARLVDIHAAMDEVMATQFAPDRFVTAQLGELDAVTGRLRWLNSGHPAPLLVRGGKVVGALECAPTLPVGFGGAVAQIAEERLEPDDHLLFYTDGVIEARSPQGDFFGQDRLADLLGRAITARLPAPETVRRLSHAILEHQSSELQDDATTLLLNWHGRAPVPDTDASAVPRHPDAPDQR